MEVSTSGPHLTFYERNAITRARFSMYNIVPEALRLDGKTFFGLHLYLVGPKFQGLRAITWLASVTITTIIPFFK